MLDWPRDPAPDAKYKYPTYGLAVELVRELGSTGLSYVLDRATDSPFDPEISRSLDALRELRERGGAPKGPWKGVNADLQRAVWTLMGLEASRALSAPPVADLLGELESRHKKISQTELLTLSYVPTDLLSQLTRRNESIQGSRRKADARRRRALNPQSDLFAASIREIMEELVDLSGAGERSGDEARAIHQRGRSVPPLEELKQRERRLGGGRRLSAWSIAVIPLTAFLTVQLEPDTLPGRVEVVSSLLEARYASTADATWQWTGNAESVRNLFRGRAARDPRSWPPALDLWLRWRVLALLERTSAYVEKYHPLPAPFTAYDVADRVGLDYGHAPRIDELLQEGGMPLDVDTTTEPRSYGYRPHE